MTKIQALSDTIMIQRLESMIEGLIDKPSHLNTDSIAKKRWVAVPVEKGRHFEEDEVEIISRAIQVLGYTECFAIATELIGEYPRCYRIPMTKEGLIDFSQECAGLNFILVPEDLSFAILCTSEDYNIFAGPLRFVESALGVDLSTARMKFREVASDAWWKGRLLEVANKYEGIPTQY